jgi:DNA-binding CsgD family transcriptional regulator
VLADLVVERERSTVLRAVGVTAGGEGPIRLPLYDAVTLDENITIAEMVFTKLPIDVAHGGSVIVQLVEVTTSSCQTAPHDDSSRVAELESALRRIHNLILQFESQSGGGKDCLPTIAEPLPDSMSVRRRQVATAALRGKAVTDIAAEFDLSPHTIRNHLKVVYRQLGVSSRAELQRRFHP